MTLAVTPPGLVAAEDRGRTVLADRVIATTARRAAGEVDRVAGITRQVAGVSVGSAAVRCEAEVSGKVASLRLRLGVDYPASVRGVTREVRRHVTERVSRLCDVHVDHVDVTVALLSGPRESKRRVL